MPAIIQSVMIDHSVGVSYPNTGEIVQLLANEVPDILKRCDTDTDAIKAVEDLLASYGKLDIIFVDPTTRQPVDVIHNPDASVFVSIKRNIQ